MFIFNFSTLSTILVFFSCFQFFFQKYNPDPHAIQESIMGITPNYQNQIPHLPPELWNIILTEYLHKKEIASLTTTCKQFLYITQDHIIPRIVAKKAIRKVMRPVTRKNFFSELMDIFTLCIEGKSEALIEARWSGGLNQYSFLSINYFLEKIKTKEIIWIKKNKMTAYYFVKYFIKNCLLYNPSLIVMKYPELKNCHKTQFELAKNKTMLYLKNNFFSKDNFLHVPFINKSLKLTFFEHGPIVFYLDSYNDEKKEIIHSRSFLYCYEYKPTFDDRLVVRGEQDKELTDCVEINKLYVAIFINNGRDKGRGKDNPMSKFEKVAPYSIRNIRQLNIVTNWVKKKAILKSNDYPNLKRLIINSSTWTHKPISIDNDFIGKKSPFELIYKHRWENYINENLKNCDGIQITHFHKKCVF